MTLIKNQSYAEEITQNTFFKAMTAKRRFEGNSSEFTWLCGIAKHLAIDECRKKSRGKMKVKKWLGIENLKTYETYISRWHEFLNKSEDGMKELDEQNQKVLTLLILQRFYQTPFQAKEDEEFYREFFERLSSVNEILGF